MSGMCRSLPYTRRQKPARSGPGALKGQETQVIGLQVGFVDTDLTRGIDMPKRALAVVVERAIAAPGRPEMHSSRIEPAGTEPVGIEPFRNEYAQRAGAYVRCIDGAR